MTQTEDFFDVLSEECLRLQMTQDHFKRFGDLPGPHAEAGVRVLLPAGNAVVPFFLRKRAGTEKWEIVDEQTFASHGLLSPETNEHLEQLLKALAKLLPK